MADAPAGGGGGLSGAEIILLVILGIGAIGVLSGNPIKPISSTSSNTAPVTQPAIHCGITLSRPIHNEHITTGTVTVVGTITPCTTDPLLSIVLTSQVVDKTGAPMSDLSRITMASATDTSASFAGNIPLTGNPAPGTGYLIVTGPVRADGTSLTARTPIVF